MRRTEAECGGNGPYAIDKSSTSVCVGSALPGVSFETLGDEDKTGTLTWSRQKTLGSLADLRQNSEIVLTGWPQKIMKDDEAASVTASEADGAAAADLSTVCTSDSEENVSVGHPEDEAQESPRGTPLHGDALTGAVVATELPEVVEFTEEFGQAFMASEHLKPLSHVVRPQNGAPYYGSSNVTGATESLPRCFPAEQGKLGPQFSGHCRGDCECWPYMCTGMCDLFAKTASRGRVCLNLSGGGDVTLGEPTVLDVFMVQEGLFRSAGFTF
ncbi:conserved hypothetical protein [Neospora caninum Liverpool]|uniref:Uncharacterized protein n=1 Tax=Neospora caninum (strain Liverpool) TaxID=572307 RepID=F0VC06_NEOCL|nr:conserved hypothetical protein [Neospora caninum Liverpool]CBZ51140.1 conserved hypothetical protein [Neospora caninum Liverpool]CEL68448.1 TPA: hypothetical protein BN1204_042150 [Neospora caninum Liverpool]|eukprot:XP_003881173.1 conserved hypothetical protein [Neospora caninum Liverpool]